MCTYTALSVTLSRTAKSIVESQVHFPESIFIHITNSYNIYSYCILEILIGFVYIIVCIMVLRAGSTIEKDFFLTTGPLSWCTKYSSIILQE